MCSVVAIIRNFRCIGVSRPPQSLDHGRRLVLRCRSSTVGGLSWRISFLSSFSNFLLAIPRPRVRQIAVFPSYTKQQTTKQIQTNPPTNPANSTHRISSPCAARARSLPVRAALLGCSSQSPESYWESGVGWWVGKRRKRASVVRRGGQMAADSAIYASLRGTPHTPPTAATLGTPSLAPVERAIYFSLSFFLSHMFWRMPST